MKNTVMKHWDLERLFPVGLEDVLLRNNEQMEALREQLEKSQVPDNFKDFLVIVEEMQKLYSDVFSIDEYAICLSSQNRQDRNGHELMD
ncbi:hypothetical protein J0K78_02685 [Halobacillus sp. GSS1]|uniref:hypothetical protein n=1 Tax=Halobacillus sp. GSS1 TaxID=2815919 RepID=UPI001A8EC371|nr:hypothetical protein [Halobacillus sp. GSS1]MBN9653159.1 hypothetical protein [Halobacillus sp. GSS1]